MIKLSKVNKIYPNGFKALRNLSFGVEKGQIFCILGPNGAGKTTTFDILTEKIPHSSGQVELEGNMIEKAENSLASMGVCSQTNSLWESMTIEEHLRIYAQIRGLSEIEESVSFLLSALGLEVHAKKQVSQLSGGTKRKLSVALALIGAPDIILLDEPTTGVDPKGRSQIWNLLKAIIKEKPVAILLSTHFIEDAELVADKLGILVNGSLVSVGALPELRKKYEDYFIVIEGAAEETESEIEKIVKTLLPKAIIDKNPDQSGLVFRVFFFLFIII